MGLFSKPKEFNINEIDMLRHKISILEHNDILRKDIAEGYAVVIGGHEIRYYSGCGESDGLLIVGSEMENKISISFSKGERDKLIKFISK